MANRLSKIYTRTGDKGQTGLSDGARIDKDSPRIEAIGAVDELNSAVGMILAYELPETVADCLIDVQHDLFDLGGELSMPDQQLLKSTYVARLETVLDEFNEDLPYLKEFILPCGGPATSCCHLARSICRRAERRLLTLSRNETVSAASLQYLNRLSDLLFVIARTLARFENGEEIFWDPQRFR
jgi:cob(I)alamin adenosyltransferase